MINYKLFLAEATQTSKHLAPQQAFLSMTADTKAEAFDA
jgi:hypothetical protein